MPPSDFKETLEKELKLKEKVAKRITQELNRFIFYPVKSNLEELYKIEITASSKPKATLPIEEKPSIPPRKDTYREILE